MQSWRVNRDKHKIRVTMIGPNSELMIPFDVAEAMKLASAIMKRAQEVVEAYQVAAMLDNLEAGGGPPPSGSTGTSKKKGSG